MASKKKCLVDTSVLMAAFALYHKMELLTFNKKDFDFIQGLKIHSFSK
jgi:predicted nucleic acid-binding protein